MAGNTELNPATSAAVTSLVLYWVGLAALRAVGIVTAKDGGLQVFAYLGLTRNLSKIVHVHIVLLTMDLYQQGGITPIAPS